MKDSEFFRLLIYMSIASTLTATVFAYPIIGIDVIALVVLMFFAIVTILSGWLGVGWGLRIAKKKGYIK